ncbi:MAG: YqaA family protein [Pseudomonadota bacterium]|nr:YqaA family protein [Pseudomonadota bacterium]
MLRRLYDWTLDLAGRRYALFALAIIAFIESSFFPIPPDVMLIPMVLAVRQRAWLIASICTIASVSGGMMGYVIGAVLFEQIGKPIIELYHYTPKFEQFRGIFSEWGAWAVLIAGITPFPYKVITIVSGATSIDFMVFSLASIFARGLRFFVVAALLWYFGDRIREFIERRLGLLFVLFVILLLVGFFATELLFS